MTLPHHRLDGPEDGAPLILGPSLGTSLAVWEPQVPALTRHHRVLRYDLPGHGGEAGGGSAAAPDAEPATVAELASRVLALADHHGWETFRYAGISLGGGIGTHLAVHHPERISSLALVCSSAWFGEPAGWHERAALVREDGTRSLLEAAPGRWFADPERMTGTPLGARLLADLAEADPAGYAACCEAVADFDARPVLSRITAPTLVVAGAADPAIPPTHASELAHGIRASALVRVAGAAHLAGVEQPEAVTEALLSHWDGATPPHPAGERGPA
ncbi:alpha/beta fold hydrolase [Streptomyces tubbatahanensis]|uniref:Alpha/beta fold hydrolase n=1 Tax=Streptomyces tubbatahanensis TaxID=2923272 RepID=A0ABY3Y0F8_9ACTN|nr:alpha/beta fold hydrolase [Streptomyces tubbatahanensis]UNT00075.1 alpha/beta fold hydrolase [Streptomyces tubbatahanensis]